MTLDPARTVDAALKLLPDTKHVVVVGGSSTFDRGVEAITKASLQAHPFLVDFTYLTDLEMSNLLDRVRHLPAQTIVLYVSLFRDAAGNQFVNATTALPLVVEASNAPVFGMSDAYMGNGAVGGYVMSFAESGQAAAQTVRDILSGKRLADIPIVTSPGLYMFDWKQLERWNLSESRLPADSIVLYREPSLWARAKWAVIGSLSVILGLAVVIAYLLRKQNQLNAARSEQMRLSGMLIEAQETERCRLASELHDDFSQRLAVLSLGLETAAEAIPESPREADRQLHELMNSAGELGADLHTLAHRLHSATLERLGLVPGMSAFCKEFAGQYAIRVAFAHQDVPKTLPSEVSLCLFRIVQEALRNVRKHSGASEVHVGLDFVANSLHLAVSDNGRGFNPKEDPLSHGLGLRSMEERARLIGARFTVHSEPQRGTRVDVWVRVRPEHNKEAAHPAAAD
jgi:signal transduction histidine kinase